MRKILFIIAIFACLKMTAQTVPTVFTDTTMQPQRHYACLETSTTWVRNQPEVTRLYVWITFDNQIDAGTLHWELRDSINVNLNPNSHVIASGDYISLNGNDYQLYQQWEADTYLFYYMAKDSLNTAYLNLKIK